MSFPKPYPSTPIAYTDWDTVIDALEVRLGASATGDLLIPDTKVIKTGVLDDDMFTIKAVDNDDQSLKIVATVQGAADPYIAFGGSEELKITTGGVITIATATFTGTLDMNGSDIQLGSNTAKITFAADDAEYIYGDGSDVIFAVASTNIFKMSAAAFYPVTADAENLGGTFNEFANLYIGTGKVYFFTDQGEYLYSGGAAISFGTGGTDRLVLYDSELKPNTNAGLSLGTDALEWNDLWIDGVAYLDAVTMHGNFTLGAHHLKTTNLLIKEGDATDFYVRDAADANYRNIRMGTAKLFSDLAMRTSGQPISAPDINAAYTPIKAKDTDGSLVEIARLTGAADPYFSTGGSQQVKFYNSGAVDFGNVAVTNVGAAGNDFGASNALVATTFTGIITMNDGYSIDTRDVDDDYYMLRARDNGAGIVEVARIQGAADPYVSFSPSQEFKFYHSGSFYVSTGADIMLLTTAPIQFRDAQISIASTTGDGYLDISADIGIYMRTAYTEFTGTLALSDEQSFQTANTDGDYIVIKARDSGVGVIEVARIVGAADPYFSLGGSQQWKFYNSGDLDAGASIYFSANAKIIAAPNDDASYLLFQAKDSGVGRVEVARLVGAADPYFAFGSSQVFKFYYSGYLDCGEKDIQNVNALYIDEGGGSGLYWSEGGTGTLRARIYYNATNYLTLGTVNSGTTMTERIRITAEVDQAKISIYNADMQMMSTNKLYFFDTAIYIASLNDGMLDLVANSRIRLGGHVILAAGKVMELRDDAIYITSADDGHMDFVADVSVDITIGANQIGFWDSGALRIESTYKLEFRDAAIYIASLNDGYLDFEADTALRFNANITTTGSMTMGNEIWMGGYAVRASLFFEMNETTTPTDVANRGKIYCKADNKLYFQDGAGAEHEVALVP